MVVTGGDSPQIDQVCIKMGFRSVADNFVRKVNVKYKLAQDKNTDDTYIATPFKYTERNAQ